jgi:hypothetical protein
VFYAQILKSREALLKQILKYLLSAENRNDPWLYESSTQAFTKNAVVKF